MSIFRKRRKATPLTIAAPVSGEIIDIADVPDPVFAGKHMGPGFAVAPVSGDFTSPIDGIVSSSGPQKLKVEVDVIPDGESMPEAAGEPEIETA